MSNVNIKRAIENIRSNTTIYTPIIEMIVNSIQAIEEMENANGKIQIRVQRDSQLELDGSLPEIIGFQIEDNGIGFTQKHRDSFDTLYTDHKIAMGGKGFGRFTGLKYFEDLHIKSIYHDGTHFKARSFKMGKEQEIIVDEEIVFTNEQKTGTTVTLKPLRSGPNFDKKLITIARSLVDRLLPYFITNDYFCPEIILSEHNGKGAICLNDFVSNELYADIQEIGIDKGFFKIQTFDTIEEFQVRIFKVYSPGKFKSRISLVAHKREVTVTAIDKFIPEFVDEFLENNSNGANGNTRNYIIKAYVFGSYLDRNVSLERGGFEFQTDSDLTLGIGQTQIEQQAALIAREVMGKDITFRQEKKKERVRSYVDEEAPWHKEILNKIDLSEMAYNPSNDEIETWLQKKKFEQELVIKRDVAKLMAEENFDNVQDNVADIVNKISDTSKNDLIHYVALRRKILDIFAKSLEFNESSKYSSEGVVHDIIFPRKHDSDSTPFYKHNLWLIDERMNFTTYISSDLPLNGGNTERPDLMVYDKRVLFRGDNEPSNPITIFEFKKPGRDDFANPSSTEDPVQQIIRYVNNIRDGKYKTPEGRKILVVENTPFYGYVICDLTTKVEIWLDREKNFTPMPDQLGWFHWMGNINLYIEVISWDKVLKDARMRNNIFFQKLGI